MKLNATQAKRLATKIDDDRKRRQEENNKIWKANLEKEKRSRARKFKTKILPVIMEEIYEEIEHAAKYGKFSLRYDLKDKDVLKENGEHLPIMRLLQESKYDVVFDDYMDLRGCYRYCIHLDISW